MLYTFTSYESIYELYVALLGSSIFMAVACSIMVSFDRLLHVVKYVKASTRCALCSSPFISRPPLDGLVWLPGMACSRRVQLQACHR